MKHALQKIALIGCYLFSYGFVAVFGQGMTPVQGIILLMLLLFQWLISGTRHALVTGGAVIIPSTVLLLASISIHHPLLPYAIYSAVFAVSSFLLSGQIDVPYRMFRKRDILALCILAVGCGLLAGYIIKQSNPSHTETLELLYIPVLLAYILVSEWFTERILLLSFTPFGKILSLLIVPLFVTFPAFRIGISYGIVMYFVQLYASSLFYSTGKLSFSLIFRIATFVSYMYPFVSFVSS